MKKILLITLFFLDIKIAMSADIPKRVDHWQINIQRNSIIRKIWRGEEVPQEDLKDYFKLIEINFNSKIEKDNPKKNVAFNNARFIDKWKSSEIEFLNFMEAPDKEKEIEKIERFAAQVAFLKEDFSVTTIGEGLNIIAAKLAGL
ncbi:MAG: hypothetical protein K0M45_03945 [Candidatus Paracaedibacteraceae bacterium]|nr:hypothetical protein [Candidatus Paracaedibacteraceae bacterium]